MRVCLLLATFLLSAQATAPALAGERMEATIFGIQEQDNWQTGADTGYWMWHGGGVLRSKGPLGTEPVDCRGAGYWDKQSVWGDGICLIGAGEHLASLYWQRGRGEPRAGSWQIRNGSGRFTGLTGDGTWLDQELPNNRWIAELDGELDWAN